MSSITREHTIARPRLFAQQILTGDARATSVVQMGPVLAPPKAATDDKPHGAPPAHTPSDLRALASAVGNRRFAQIARLAYWAESDPTQRSGRRSGTSVHNEVLPAMGKENRIFTEAPVPQASKDRAGVEGNRGYADLYKAKTTIGFEFPTGSQWPTRMPSNRGTKYRGERFEHIQESAPTVEAREDGTPVIKKLGKAPQLIVIGDLKGGMDSTETADGPAQLGSYMDGFRLAGEELTKYGSDFPERVDPDRKGSRAWKPQSRTFRSSELEVPDFYTPGKARAQRSVRLVLVGGDGWTDKNWSKRNHVRGKLYVFPDTSSREGIWVYVWAPDQEVALDDLPLHVRQLGPEIAERLRQPILAPPIARKVRPGAVRRLARKPPATDDKPATDPFPYAKWKDDHRRLSDQAATAENEPGWIDAEAAAKIDEANATARKYGLKAPKVANEKLKGGQAVKEIKLWTGKSGELLGRFRNLFGTAFTAVANLYFKIRDKFRSMLSSASDKGKSFSGGFPGAALKAAYSVIKGAARHIVGKTVERLKGSLVEGTKKKLKTLVGADRVETVEEKLKEVGDIVRDLESGAIEKLESLFDGVIGKYQSIVTEIENVKNIVGEALDIADKVKWGARVIACLSPPGLGCLWILAQHVLEKAAAKVVDTCWFKRKITPLINKLPFVKDLPGKLAKGIRERLVPLLPDPLKDMFPEIEQKPVDVGEGDIGCDTNDDPERDALTAERRAMYDLIEAVGEERFDALVDALMAAGVRFDKKLSVTEIYEAKKIIVGSRVTAKQLRHYAKWYAPFADKRKFGPLGDFVTGLAKSDPDAVGPFAHEDADGDGDGPGGGGGAIEGVPTTAAPPGGPHRPYEFVSLGAFNLKAAEGSTVTLDVTVKVDGQTVVLRNVALVVADRKRIPGGEKLKLVMAREMVFELGGGPDSAAKRTMTLAKTSTFTKRVLDKPAKKKSRRRRHLTGSPRWRREPAPRAQSAKDPVGVSVDRPAQWQLEVEVALAEEDPLRGVDPAGVLVRLLLASSPTRARRGTRSGR